MDLGRITGLPEPSDWQSHGETAILSGFSSTADQPTTMNLRDRLLGYDNNLDEPIVPIIVPSEPRLSGFYRIQNISVPTDRVAVAKGWFAYQASLERVRSFHGPILEDILVAGTRTPNAGFVVAVGIVGLPSTAKEFLILGPDLTAGGNTFTRTSVDGAMTLRIVFSATSTSSLRFAIPVADYLRGACTIQAADPAGGTLRDVVGRQLYAPDLLNWTISNGLVRVSATTALTATNFYVQNAASGGTWGVSYPFRILNNLTPFEVFDARTSLTILRNSPEECVLRLGGYSTTGVPALSAGAMYLDIRIRRGQRTAEFLFSAPSKRWAISQNGGIIAMATGPPTGGMVATVNDASGSRLLMISGETATLDPTNNQIYLTNAQTTFSFAIGAEVPGGTATANEDKAALIAQYTAVIGERVQVVGR